MLILAHPRVPPFATMTFVTRFDIFYLVLGILSLVPLVLPYSLHLHGTALEQALRNTNVNYAFVASISVTLPLIVEIVLDWMTPITSDRSLARKCLVLSLLFPMVYLITNDPVYYVVFIYAQRIIW